MKPRLKSDTRRTKSELESCEEPRSHRASRSSADQGDGRVSTGGEIFGSATAHFKIVDPDVVDVVTAGITVGHHKRDGCQNLQVDSVPHDLVSGRGANCNAEVIEKSDSFGIQPRSA